MDKCRNQNRGNRGMPVIELIALKGKMIFGQNLELPVIVQPRSCFWYARRQHFLDLEWAINFVKHDGMQAMFHKLTGTVNQNQEFDVKI